MSADLQQQDFNIDELLSSCADPDDEERQQLDQRLLEATATKKRLSFQAAKTPAGNNSAVKHTPAEGNKEESEQSAEDEISKTVKKKRQSDEKANQKPISTTTLQQSDSMLTTKTQHTATAMANQRRTTGSRMGRQKHLKMSLISTYSLERHP